MRGYRRNAPNRLFYGKVQVCGGSNLANFGARRWPFQTVFEAKIRAFVFTHKYARHD